MSDTVMQVKAMRRGFTQNRSHMVVTFMKASCGPWLKDTKTTSWFAWIVRIVFYTPYPTNEIRTLQYTQMLRQCTPPLLRHLVHCYKKEGILCKTGVNHGITGDQASTFRVNIQTGDKGASRNRTLCSSALASPNLLSPSSLFLSPKGIIMI